MPNGFKSYASDLPYIRACGHYLSTHPRHFLQQSDYTLSSKLLEDGLHFCSHDEACHSLPANQDAIWKFTIPSNERMKVLKLLDSYNLNEFSLFRSEETLLQTLWNREQFRNPTSPETRFSPPPALS